MKETLRKAIEIFKKELPEAHGHFTAEVTPTGYVVYIMDGTAIYAEVNTKTNTVRV